MSKDMSCVRLANAVIELRSLEEFVERSGYNLPEPNGRLVFKARENELVELVQRYMDEKVVTLLDFYNVMRDPESFSEMRPLKARSF